MSYYLAGWLLLAHYCKRQYILLFHRLSLRRCSYFLMLPKADYIHQRCHRLVLLHHQNVSSFQCCCNLLWKHFLELYNALSGSDYHLEDVNLERKIIDQTLYKTYNNDVSWEIDGKLIVLVEYQSTINENMPFRCLEYVTRIYEGIFPQRKRYAEKVFKIPNPDFYVVYIGKDNYPLEKELRLSDAFYKKDGSKLELVVKVKNCTDPKLLPIAGNCDILKQ